MKKKSLIFIVFIMFLLGFTGYKYVKFEYEIQNSNNITPILTNIQSLNEQNIANINTKSEVSEIIDETFFLTVFEKAKLGISFETAEDFVKSTGYEYLSEKAGENNISTIKIYKNSNKNGDRINFIFMYNNTLEIETLKSISYFIPQENKEVVIENLSDDNKEWYMQYKTHIVGSEYKRVRNIKELAKFLFNYEEINNGGILKTNQS